RHEISPAPWAAPKQLRADRPARRRATAIRRRDFELPPSRPGEVASARVRARRAAGILRETTWACWAKKRRDASQRRGSQFFAILRNDRPARLAVVRACALLTFICAIACATQRYALPMTAARLAVLHQLYLERDPAIAARESAVRDLGAMLRTAIGKKRLGPAALKNGTELLATLDLEQGIFQGRTVDVPLLDSMLKSGDEASLLRCAQRLPDAALRTEAKRRVIQLHIQAPPLPEVRANASALEERMMGGTNPVSLGEHPAVRAFVDLARSAQRSI